MENWRISLTKGKVLEISNSSKWVRCTVKQDTKSVEFTDIDCDSEELKEILLLIEKIGFHVE